MRVFIKPILIAIFLILEPQVSWSKTLKIVSSINPIFQISKTIASEDQNILLVKTSMSEHNYMLKPSDIANIDQADAIFYVSNDLEFYLTKALQKNQNKNNVELIRNPNLKLLNVRTDKKLSVNKVDPHIWLNPENAIVIARQIADNLSRINPDGAKLYHKNLDKFIVKVKKQDQKIKTLLAKIKNENYLFYHNGYQYFEDYYQLKPVHIISFYHNQRLTAKDIKKVSDLIKNNNIQCLFSSPQEESDVALKISESNKIKFSILDPVGSNINNQNDYTNILNNIALDLTGCLVINNEVIKK